jgi:flagellar basal-body rod protein FlgF
MDNTSYIALSRQLTLRRELDVVANNVANINTTGFKLENLMVQSEPAAPAYNDPIKAPANFAYDRGVGRDFRQGTLQQTGNELDLAIEGEGVFFTIIGPNGPVYTRNGAFTMGPDGTVQTDDGRQLQGDGGPLTLDPKKPSPTISADGIVSQGLEQVGRINVVRIPQLSDLEKQGDGTYRLTTNAQPLPATDVKVAQGYLESSNVNPIKEITHLVEINRSYAAISNMIQQTAELNRSAVERLGRVA